MKVLVATTWYPDDAKPQMAPFCRQHVQLLAREHRVQVLHVRLGGARPDYDEVDGTVKVRHRSLRPREAGSVLELRRELAALTRGADAVHTMAFSSALVQLLALPRAATPWIHTEHWNGVRTPVAEGGLWPKVAFLRHVLRLTDAATGVTDDLTDVLARFTRRGGAITVPCVVALPDKVTGIPEGPTLPLVAVGWLIDRKDPLLAVRALKLVRDVGIDASLTWIGSGPLEDATRDLSASYGVGSHVTLAGPLPQEEVVRRIGEARAFFLPSRHENFFVSAAEAIGAGRPVVVGATGGHGEYICDSNGVLVAEQTPEAYATAIRALYDRLEAGRYDAVAMSDAIRSRYGADAVADALARAYALALASRGRPPRLAHLLRP